MSELFPAKSIALQVVRCTDATKIRVFNRWVDLDYLPELKATPGVLDVYRYLDVKPDMKDRAVGRFAPSPPGTPDRYLMLYRLEGDDPWAVMQQLADDDKHRRAAGELPEFFESESTTVWDFIAMRQSVQEPVRPATRLPDGMPEIVLVVFNNMELDKQKEHTRWWLYAHAHDLLETPGMVQCSRFRTLNPNPSGDDALALNIYEFDLDDPTPSVYRILDDDEKVRKPQGRFSPFNRPCEWGASGLYRHWDPMGIGR